MTVCCLIVFILAISLSTTSAAQKFTYIDLVNQMVDLEALAALPADGEQCAQWSSYDRASRYDAETDKYVGWDANGDGNGVIRTEGDLVIMAEIKGPGCIRRIWSAAPRGGRVMIYLDGSPTPQVDLPFAGYFDLKNSPFVFPSLVYTVAQGRNNYVPIPFQKSCKIVAEKGWGNYYHWTYTTFPEGTIVPTFKLDLSKEELEALAQVDRFLMNSLGTDPAGKRYGELVDTRKLALAPGQTATAADLRGERAITAIKVKLDPAAIENPVGLMREVVIRITWDGERNPGVWSPLGDFFGTSHGINEYRSLPLGMTSDEFYSYWYMPFEKEALVELVNEGEQAVSLETTVTHAPLTRPASELGRFHVKWHRDEFLPIEPERRAIDWTMLKTNGRGRYCGVMLHVYNPKGGWWGEGDEKFFVDGEKFPSTFGTGSEDYFGYAWCDPTLFQRAFHNQSICENGNAGHVSVNRWHISDNVPFQSSFEAAIEKYCPNEQPTLYAATAYWYQSSGVGDPYRSVPVTERIGFYDYEQFFVAGALEGESLEVLEKTAGELDIQIMGNFGDLWSKATHLWWTGARPGAKLVLAFPVETPGKYEIICAMTKARDYGIVQVYVNDKKMGAPIDLYDGSVVPTGEMPLGTVEMGAGTHKLTLEVVGANESAVKSYLVGLDYIRLAEVE